MNDIRSTVLWVIFGFSLIMLWDRWQVHNGQPPTFFPGNGAPVVQEASAPAGSASSVAAANPTTGAAAQATAPAAPVSEKVEVVTDVYKLTFDTLGGSLVGAQLLQYPEKSNDPHSTPIVLLQDDAQHQYKAQSGLAGSGALPNHHTPMRLVSTQRALADGQDTLQVQFQSDAVNGIQLTKTYTLQRGSYAIGMQYDVANSGTQTLSPHLYEQLVRDSSKAPGGSTFYSTYTGPAFYSSEGKYQKVDFADMDKNKVDLQKTATDGYVAMVQHYFASAWLLPAGTTRDNYARKDGNNLYAAGHIMALGDIAPGASTTLTSTLFVGPQDEAAMKPLSPELYLVKDYGLLDILARPLYWLLTWLHSFLHNWGWAIVALVVLLKIAFYGLNHKAYASMAKMKAINPKIQDMRERYKDEPQKMQQEMMRIYREEKVNPLGGCLPILIQIPVFIALYNVLLASVEMRGAPWIGWVHDLSTPDPYFILPLLMTASSLFQVWLNPTPPDPMQAKMMWFMPLAFGIMFFFFPSGLVLYWLTNNILSIAQQWFINKRLGVG